MFIKYSKAENIAFKQQMLIEDTANNYPKTLSLELEKQWVSEIKSYRDIRISLELQLLMFFLGLSKEWLRTLLEK